MDEVSQVIQFEFEGIKFVVKGGLKMASWIMQAIKAIMQHHDEKAGKHVVKDINKISEGGPPQVIMIDEKDLDKVVEIAEKNGLRFSFIVDLNANDGKVPLYVPNQDISLFSAIINGVLEKDLLSISDDISKIDKEISDCENKLKNCKPEEKHDLEVKIENLKNAKAEVLQVCDQKTAELENGSVMSFEEYIKTGVGTEFEKDPEKAVAELEKGVDIAPNFPAKECFSPIRHMSKVPDSKIRFYVPDIGTTVTRNFVEEDGIVYSDYSLKTDKGEIYSFSDKGLTTEEWNKNVLPSLYEKSGILESTPCRVFDSKDRLEAYVKYFNNVELPSEQKLKSKGELVFSSAEVKDEMLTVSKDIGHAKTESNMRLTSAENMVSFSVSENDISIKEGQMAIVVNGDEFVLDLDSKNLMSPVTYHSDTNEFEFKLDKESFVKHKDKEGNINNMSIGSFLDHYPQKGASGKIVASPNISHGGNKIGK